MKKKVTIPLLAVCLLWPASVSSCGPARKALDPDHVLWYDEPVAEGLNLIDEGLPLGNGRLGMMGSGGIADERIFLNEISLWSGSEVDYGNPDAGKNLPLIRELLSRGENDIAQQVMKEHFVPRKPTDGSAYGTYQMLSEVTVRHRIDTTGTTGYRRMLDLGRALATTTFRCGGVEYVREYFVSRPGDVIVMHFSAGRPSAVSFDLDIRRNGAETVAADGLIELRGSLDSGVKGKEGMKYALFSGVKLKGGRCETVGQTCRVTGADEAWVVVSAATDYLFGEGYAARAEELLRKALASNLDADRKRTEALHRELFDRASIRIEGRTDASYLPTDERLVSYQAVAGDNSLVNLYYNFGRYLLISSTRPGSLPPNLQGLWANTYDNTPWSGDYHTNINLQMNHWMAEASNLHELVEPLVKFTERLVPSGEKSAGDFYGPDAEGWVQHMKTGLWNVTSPGDDPSWGATSTGGAWLCQHLYEHYLYRPDPAFLQEIYPVIKGAARFFLSTMVEEPAHGWLVTSPSSSPENSFYFKDDRRAHVCMGPTMDVEIITELYRNVMEAAGILGVDKEFSDSLAAALDRFPPLQTSPGGYLQEWLEDYRETDPHHRHVSHLYGLHPGHTISVAGTPALARACRRTLERRGDGGTGWSRAWKINFWARLQDGDHALTLLKNLLQPAFSKTDLNYRSGGTYRNLFCAHPPFQIDGNFGGAAGIQEMLLQNYKDEYTLLPALPQDWPDGKFTGRKRQGGRTVDLEWKDGRPVLLRIDGVKTPVSENRIKH